MRAALYARYSSDLQKPTSIVDQLTSCRRHAERMGAEVVAEFTDAAQVGSSRIKRGGLAAMVAAAKAGAFDIIVAEALDRVTRSGGDAWDIFEELQLAGVTLHTIAQGKVEEMAVGFAGTVAALELKANALRVRRGMAGVVAEGRWPTSPPYGYRPRIAHDHRGERIRGLLEIAPDEAEVVRRIAVEYLAGSSPQQIAHRLNREAVPGPRGGAWEGVHIVGQKASQRGVLRNPIYGGELVWNRQSRMKIRRTGGVKTRTNAQPDQVRAPVPALAIHDADTWAALQARIADRSLAVAAAGNPSAANAPRRLFSGLIACGTCGGLMATSGPGPRYRCRTRDRHGETHCDNNRSPRADAVEAEALTQLRRDLLHPATIEAFVDEYRRASAKRQAGGAGRRAALEHTLTEATTRAARLVDQLAEGLIPANSPTVAAKLKDLEHQAATARAALAEEHADADRRGDVVALHPNAGRRYRQIVEDLRATLDAATEASATGADNGAAGAERDAARAALRHVVKAVVIHKGARHGEWTLTVTGDLTTLLGLAPPSAVLSQRA